MKKIFYIFLFLFLSVNAADAEKIPQRLTWPALKSGDCIGLLSSGTYTSPKDFEGTVDLLKSRGYRVKIAPSATAMYEHFAGTDRKRAEDINNFFKDKDIKAILCVKGGYGSARLLDRLDYKAISKNPKPLIGFSDVTALHIAIGQRAGLSTVHAPMLVSFARPNLDSEYNRRNFFAGLNKENFSGEIPMPENKKLETLMPGKAEGIIMGGNLTVLTSLVGTPYELDGKGVLLLIEEVGEVPRKIDRMFNQLYQSGLLNRVNGILLGSFIGCDNENDPTGLEDITLEQVLKHYARLSRKPVIKNVPVGHGNYNLFLPLGLPAVMNADGDGTASLVLK